VKTPLRALVVTILAAACTGSEPSRSADDSRLQEETRNELMKKMEREHLRIGETDLVDDDYVRNGPK
jgi:cytochrome c556